MFPEELTRVATELVAGCRENRAAENLETLYAADAVSVEALAMPGSEDAEAKGLEAIRAKHAWWEGAMEVHSMSADGPYLHGDDRFGVIFQADVTERESGKRTQMKELGIYTVAGGKIVREEFYYSA